MSIIATFLLNGFCLYAPIYALKFNRKLIKSSLRHLTLQQLKVISIWEVGTNSRAFQTILAVREVRFLLPKTQNIRSVLIILSYKKLYRKQPVKLLIKEPIFGKSGLSFLTSSFLKAGGLYCTFFERHEIQ